MIILIFGDSTSFPTPPPYCNKEVLLIICGNRSQHTMCRPFSADQWEHRWWLVGRALMGHLSSLLGRQTLKSLMRAQEVPGLQWENLWWGGNGRAMWKVQVRKCFNFCTLPSQFLVQQLLPEISICCTSLNNGNFCFWLCFLFYSQMGHLIKLGVGVGNLPKSKRFNLKLTPSSSFKQ